MRKRRLTKVVAAALSFTMCLGTFTGCKKKEGKDGKGSNDVYSALAEAREIKTGTFEMKMGAELPEEDEKMEIILSGVATQESFDIEVAVDVDIPEMDVEGTVTRMIYDDEHLYINVADTMEFVNSISYMGELSDFGIDSEYIDLYVGDLFAQKEDAAVEEMADLMLEVLEDAAVATDKKEGAGKDGSIEFKDDEVITFIGNFAESFKENAEEFVELTAESATTAYDYNYDKILDYYADIFEEYGVDVEEFKDAMEQVETTEITDADKEMMVEEIETGCDEIIATAKDDEDADVKGSKFAIDTSLDGKKGSRKYECNIDFLAASESDDENVRLYLNYSIEEGKGEVKAPSDSLGVKEILEILEPFMEMTDPGVADPEVDPTEENPALINDDGSYGLGCEWGDCEYSGRIDFTPAAGYVFDETLSDIGFHVYDNAEMDSLYLSVYEGNDYKDGYEYATAYEKGDAPEGVITTPVGDMPYIIDIADGYTSIYGFIIIDPEHYLLMDYTIYSSDDVTEKLISELTNLAQGLKAAQ